MEPARARKAPLARNWIARAGRISPSGPLPYGGEYAFASSARAAAHSLTPGLPPPLSPLASLSPTPAATDRSPQWDNVENKTGFVLYSAGAFLAVWFSSTLVTALNAIPLLPKFMELVGLGYTSWFGG